MCRRIANAIILVIATALLIATQPAPGPPVGEVERTSLVRAGESELQVRVTAHLRDAGDPGTQPFLAEVEARGATAPDTGGTPEPAGPVTVSVRADGHDGAHEVLEGVATGACEAGTCRAAYTVTLALAEPSDHDVIVSWTMRIEGVEALIDTAPDASIDVTIDEDLPSGIVVEPVDAGATGVRLDRVGAGDTEVAILNYDDRPLDYTLGSERDTIPQQTSRRLEPFAGCNRVACSAEVHFDRRLSPAEIAVTGPVVVSGFDLFARQQLPRTAPDLVSRSVTVSVPVTWESDAWPVEIKVRGPDGSALALDADATVALRVDVQLTEAARGAAVRAPATSTTPPWVVVLSEAAPSASYTELVPVGNMIRDDAEEPVYPGALDFAPVSRRHAQVEATVQALVFDGGLPEGSRVTARINRPRSPMPGAGATDGS